MASTQAHHGVIIQCECGCDCGNHATQVIPVAGSDKPVLLCDQCARNWAERDGMLAVVQADRIIMFIPGGD